MDPGSVQLTLYLSPEKEEVKLDAAETTEESNELWEDLPRKERRVMFAKGEGKFEHDFSKRQFRLKDYCQPVELPPRPTKEPPRKPDTGKVFVPEDMDPIGEIQRLKDEY